MREVTESVEEEFGYASMQVMSFEDVYAGKICAALDRQHPRDLFDIKFLLENEGISDRVRKTFLVYLISHNRPISELLNPREKEFRSIYEGEFASMSSVHVPLADLESARGQLIRTLRQALTEEEKAFLLSFKSLVPDWSLLGLEGVKDLPAVQWKLLNLKKMPEEKWLQALETLKATLFEMH